MTDENYKTVIGILAASDQIEHYKTPIISNRWKDAIAIFMLGGFCFFLLGFYLGVRF